MDSMTVAVRGGTWKDGWKGEIGMGISFLMKVIGSIVTILSKLRVFF